MKGGKDLKQGKTYPIISLVTITIPRVHHLANPAIPKHRAIVQSYNRQEILKGSQEILPNIELSGIKINFDSKS